MVTNPAPNPSPPSFLHTFAILCRVVFNISELDALQRCSVAVTKFPFPLLEICQYYIIYINIYNIILNSLGD